MRCIAETRCSSQARRSGSWFTCAICILSSSTGGRRRRPTNSREPGAHQTFRTDQTIPLQAQAVVAKDLAPSGSPPQELRRVEGRKPALEIALEILDILQSDVKPQCGSARRPFGGRAVGGAVEWNDEALEAAP